MQNYLLTLSEWLGVFAVTQIAGISPRFRRRPLIFKYPRREALIAFALFGAGLALAVFFYLNQFSLVVPGLENLVQPLGVRAVLAVLTLGLFVSALVFRAQPFLSMGWNKLMLWPNFQLGLALAFLTIFLRGKASFVLDGINASEGSTLIALILIALAEESVFRGYLHFRLCSWLGEWVGWIVTALLFTVWQTLRLWFQVGVNDVNAFAISVGITFVQALLLGWIVRKGGHVIAPAFYRAFSDWVVFLV